MVADPINNSFGLPNQSDVFEEIAKTDQKIVVSTVARRYGKLATLVSGFDNKVDIKSTAKALKEKLACGGTVKDGVIELQGNHKKQVKNILIKLGFPEDSISD
jgi:translation initiation factor 1